MKNLLMFLMGAGAICAPAASSLPVFTPVSGFSLEKYLGTWYEVVRMPVSFEKDLIKVTATYELLTNGKVSVLNQGIKKATGKNQTAHGKAKFAARPDVGHLKVSFFGPFYADYLIVALDTASYKYAMVVSKGFKYLWVLSRTPKLDPTVLDGLLARAKDLGFDLSKLIMVEQDPN
jgi:apolipoprotein D and lipocalin family protein